MPLHLSSRLRSTVLGAGVSALFAILISTGSRAATPSRPAVSPVGLQALARQPNKELRDDHWEESFLLETNRATQLMLRHEDERVTMTLTLPGQARPKAWPLQSLDATFLEGVWTGRLNDDDQPDFVIALSAHGNGLNAHLTTVMFLLSGAGGYRASYLDGYNFDVRHLVVPEKETAVQWLQTEFVSAVGRDQKTHSFWVERRWRITASRLELVPTVAARWVQFTLAPNHRETPLLSPEQKRQEEAALPKVAMELRAAP
jgi:hypothetical protein